MSAVADLPEWFRGTAAGRAALAEGHQQATAARRAIVTQIQALAQQKTAAVAKHDKLCAPLVAARDAATEKLRAAEAKLGEAQRLANRDIGDAAAGIDRLTRQLRATAPPRIAATRHGLWDRYSEKKHELWTAREVPTGEKHAETLKPVMRTESNRAAIARLLDAIRTASNRLDAMAVEAFDDVDAAIAVVTQPVDAAWASVSDFAPEA
jgi:chromosome segregation ATPase